MQMAVSTSTNTQTASIDRLEVSVYTIPTETPESDGTLEWHSTTMAVVHGFLSNRYHLLSRTLMMNAYGSQDL
jgi:hypothetical protein